MKEILIAYTKGGSFYRSIIPNDAYERFINYIPDKGGIPLARVDLFDIPEGEYSPEKHGYIPLDLSTCKIIYEPLFKVINDFVVNEEGGSAIIEDACPEILYFAYSQNKKGAELKEILDRYFTAWAATTHPETHTHDLSAVYILNYLFSK